MTSQIESGKLKLCRVRADLATVLAHCYEDFLPKCTAKSQSLALEVPEALPAVLCDPDKILQVLVNLLGNAHKFADEKASIVLRAVATADGVRVEVEDDGAGIPPDRLARIFEHESGIGISNVNERLKAIFGPEHRIRLESEPGLGVRAEIEIPAGEQV